MEGGLHLLVRGRWWCWCLCTSDLWIREVTATICLIHRWRCECCDLLNPLRSPPFPCLLVHSNCTTILWNDNMKRISLLMKFPTQFLSSSLLKSKIKKKTLAGCPSPYIGDGGLRENFSEKCHVFLVSINRLCDQLFQARTKFWIRDIIFFDRVLLKPPIFAFFKSQSRFQSLNPILNFWGLVLEWATSWSLV